MARIHYLDDNNQPQVIDVNETSGDVLVGRSSDCQIRTAGHSVSRKHARIGWQDGLYVLEDLGSSNGTFYFTDRLDPNVPVILEDGVIFRCGAFELRFERETLDATLEQPVVYAELGIPPPPFDIPPPPMQIPPPPFAIPPPPPPPLRMVSSIEDASTSGFALGNEAHQEVKIHVSSAQSAVMPAPPETWPEEAPAGPIDEPDAVPILDDNFGMDVPVLLEEDDSARGAVDEPESAPEEEPAAEPESPIAAPETGAAATAADDAALGELLAAAREEVEARTALWRQALADLSDAHQEAEAAIARADALQAERDHLQATFTEAESARRQLSARLEMLEGQYAAAEQALLTELAAARAGRPSPAADSEMQRLRAELTAAQTALRGLDDQSEAEAVELRRQLTEALAENDRLSAQLDAASLPTTPFPRDPAESAD